jgi:hypothetical protein
VVTFERPPLYARVLLLQNSQPSIEELFTPKTVDLGKAIKRAAVADIATGKQQQQQQSEATGCLCTLAVAYCDLQC